jgi:hypothetical protein
MLYCPSERLSPRIVASRKPATSPVSNEQNRRGTHRRRLSPDESALGVGIPEFGSLLLHHFGHSEGRLGEDAANRSFQERVHLFYHRIDYRCLIQSE